VVHLRDAGKQDRLIRHGTPGWQLVLEAEPGEPVIDKEHDDGFVGTSLAAALSGVARPCLVGIQSEMCVAATARGALARGHVVVLPRDGHATHDVPADGRAPAVPAALVSRVAEWSLGDTVVTPDRLDDVSFAVST
jgi:nicotinamidase-related amidase